MDGHAYWSVEGSRRADPSRDSQEVQPRVLYCGSLEEWRDCRGEALLRPSRIHDTAQPTTQNHSNSHGLVPALPREASLLFSGAFVSHVKNCEKPSWRLERR